MKAFPWRRGMTAIDEQGKRWLIVENDGKNWSQCRPDSSDGATKGALLEAVREAWQMPTLYPRWCSRGVPAGAWLAGTPATKVTFEEGWGFYGLGFVKGDYLAQRVGFQPSEFAALEAAWQAAP